VILYAQSWKPILANAVALTLISYVQFFVFLVMLGLPAAAVGVLLPSLGVALGIGVLVGAWMLKLAVADAYAMAATLLAYHRSTEGMTPDPEWQARLEQASDKFAELKRKAAEKMGGSSQREETESTPTSTEAPGSVDPTDAAPATPDAPADRRPAH
jgi:cytoskeletal protein RodZ